MSRPLIKPKDLFTKKMKLKSFLSSVTKINAKTLKYKFNKFSNLEDSIHKLFLKKI